MKHCTISLVAVAALAGLSSRASAIDVFLDFTDFAPNATTAWTIGGAPGGGLTASDFLYLTGHGIKGKMESQFGGYSVTFHTTAPGGTYETIKFGASTSGSAFGVATRIDWRNVHKDDIAHIFTHNFGSIISALPSDHETSLERFANALAGTAGHELGHNLGLQHYDAYGHPTITAPGYGGIVGQQNDSIMATGSTGLSLIRRGDDARSFNVREKLKLDYADGVSTSLGPTVSEIAGPNGTLATAQSLLGTMLPSGSTGINVTGSLSSGTDADLFKFVATAGSHISANTFSAFTHSSPSDTGIVLLDAGGTALFSNGDISFSGSSFMAGSGPYSSDSLIQNFVAPYTGTYYLGVVGTAGDYDLLLSGLSPVPEPGTVALLSVGVVALLRRRRRPQAA